MSPASSIRHSIKQRMQKSLYQTADAGDILSDSGCRSLSIRHRCRRHSIKQRMQYQWMLSIRQWRHAGVSLSDSGCRRQQKSLYQTADAVSESLSDSGGRSLSIRQQDQTADAGDTLSDRSLSIRQRMQEVTLSDSGCRRLSDSGCRRQRTQESLYQTAHAGDTLSDSGCLSIRQRMQETLYQTADAEVSLSDSGCRRHSIRQRMI